MAHSFAYERIPEIPNYTIEIDGIYARVESATLK
jgi:hypothetical protein